MSTATARALDPTFLDEFAHLYMEAWNAHDAEAVAACFTEDVDFYDPAIGAVRGRQAVADWVRACDRAFPDFRFEEPGPAYLARDRPSAIAPWRMRATNTGPIDPPGFAPTGRPLTIDGLDRWEFRDRLVCRYRAEYDSMDVMRQLGLLPPSGSRAEKAMAALQRAGSRLRRRS